MHKAPNLLISYSLKSHFKQILAINTGKKTAKQSLA